MKNLDIGVYGSFSYDLIKLSDGRESWAVGGAGAYASLAAANCGVSVGVFGLFSTLIPERLKRIIQEYVELEMILWDIREPLHFNIQYDNLQNATYIVSGHEKECELHIPDSIPEFELCKLIHITTFGGPQKQLEIAKKMRDNSSIMSATTSKDYINWGKKYVNAVIEEVDFFFLNASELLLLTTEDDFDAAINSLMLQRNDKTFVVTRGEKGVTVVNKCYRLDFKALPVQNVLDTTGAGESFAGAFVAEYSKHKDITLSVTAGLIASQNVIQNWGILNLITHHSRKITGSGVNLGKPHRQHR